MAKTKRNVLDGKQKFALTEMVRDYISGSSAGKLSLSEFRAKAGQVVGCDVTRGNVEGALEVFDKLPSDVFRVDVASNSVAWVITEMRRLQARVLDLEKRLEGL